MRKKIVAGNWKMNLDHDAALKLTSEVVNMVKDEASSDVQVILCPPFVHLGSTVGLAKEVGQIAVGAQNCHQEAAGAYTGEIAADMLASYGVGYVILGHSERRAYFHEDNALLAKKTDAVLAQNMCPVFCVGELLEEREAGKQVPVVARQLAEGLFHLSAEAFAQVVIAYEPVWAIGTGKTASTEQAQEMHAAIRKMISEQYGADTADACSILYGGSCKPSNAQELFACPDVDGGLIGGASLKARDFVDIIKSF